MPIPDSNSDPVLDPHSHCDPDSNSVRDPKLNSVREPVSNSDPVRDPHSHSDRDLNSVRDPHSNSESDSESGSSFCSLELSASSDGGSHLSSATSSLLSASSAADDDADDDVDDANLISPLLASADALPEACSRTVSDFSVDRHTPSDAWARHGLLDTDRAAWWSLWHVWSRYPGLGMTLLWRCHDSDSGLGSGESEHELGLARGGGAAEGGAEASRGKEKRTTTTKSRKGTSFWSLRVGPLGRVVRMAAPPNLNPFADVRPSRRLRDTRRLIGGPALGTNGPRLEADPDECLRLG
ncbi:unnamed protein product [Protopolystoma xenopodis]|uniref:Uncharacterized protein n=1 Tax=Protopolystoma xenopodis TaxID=117903 RepID=A0A3S5B699_9PLAT|nr:unnamed protein product [Protopolystoma xenopodis]